MMKAGLSSIFSFFPGPVRGAFSVCLYAANTVFWAIPLFITAFLKLLIPTNRWRRLCGRALGIFADLWVACNNFNQRLFSGIRWDVRITKALERGQWYLVMANHQCWADILVLQRVLHRQIPALKFFLKKELFWVPLLGFAWWALDFPFVKRYSKSYLEKYPHLRGKDIEITKKACEKFKNFPVSIMNFVEGTRFTREKHRTQGSPYGNLLKSRAGGVAFVLAAMGEHLHQILDVTIAYPKGVKNFWAFACGHLEEIRVHVRSLPITPELIGNYDEDVEFRTRFQKWLNGLWEEKDRCLNRLLSLPEGSGK